MSGRPSLYTAEIAERILDGLSNGRRLADICGDPGMPSSATVWQWVAEDRQGFAARYRAARKTDKAGRPSLYTAAIAERILGELSNGRTLADLCGDPGMPSTRTVWQWATEDREGFAARYRRSRKIAGAKGGGPTVYTADLAGRILDELSGGRTLADVCRDPGMPVPSTVRNWASENREDFAARYKRAREIGYDAMADQILEIADDSRNDWTLRRRRDGKTEYVLDHQNIGRSRLRIVARLWLLSKALPRNYGDRPNLIARLERCDDLAALMKAIDGRTRGLPNPGKH